MDAGEPAQPSETATPKPWEGETVKDGIHTRGQQSLGLAKHVDNGEKIHRICTIARSMRNGLCHAMRVAQELPVPVVRGINRYRELETDQPKINEEIETNIEPNSRFCRHTDKRGEQFVAWCNRPEAGLD